MRAQEVKPAELPRELLVRLPAASRTDFAVLPSSLANRHTRAERFEPLSSCTLSASASLALLQYHRPTTRFARRPLSGWLAGAKKNFDRRMGAWVGCVRAPTRPAARPPAVRGGPAEFIHSSRAHRAGYFPSLFDR